MSVFRRIMLGGGIDIDIDALPDTQKIYYKATAKVTPKSNSLGAPLIANKWDSTTGDGIIVCYKDISNIGNDAFSSNTSLTSITIPNSVTSIGSSAFRSCPSLTGIIVSEGNSVYDSRENCNAVIKTATNELAIGCNSTIIPDSVTSIGRYALYNCTSLTSIIIPDSVTSIGDYAFYGCSGSLTINSKIIETDYTSSNRPSSTWLRSSKFTELILGDNIEKIGSYAFYNYSSMTSVTIPDSVTSIGNNAFYNCTSLENTTIGNGVTAISSSAFNGCTGELVLNFNIPNGSSSNSSIFSSSKFTKVIIGDNVTTIGNFAFASTSSLTSITIGDNVTSIGNDAFYNCSSITSISIGNNVTTIGYSAFFCDNLKEFKGKFAADGGRCLIIDGVLNAFALGCGVTQYTIPDSVTSIGREAFYKCTSLTSVTIGDGVTEIRSSAFNNCSNLTSVYCKATIPPRFGGSAFNYNAEGRKIYTYEECVDIYKEAWSNYADSIVADGNISESITTTLLYTTSDGAVIDASKFPVKTHTYNNGVGELILYGELKVIPASVFYDFGNLTTITIPDSVTTVGEYAFRGCYNLTSITIPDRVNSIGNYAFYNCYNLTSVTIGESVTTIGEHAFDDCYRLTSVIIPNSVTTIGDWVFSDCNKLTSVTIGNGITSIEYSSFSGCTNLTSVTIPDSVTRIEGFAFSHCSNLTSVTIPDSVTEIEFNAFSNCSNLISVTIPDGVTTIGDSAFTGCDSLTEFTGKFAEDNGRILVVDGTLVAFAPAGITEYSIPDGVTTIGDSAFRDCVNLTSVTISDSVVNIGPIAFGYCDNLTSVTIPDSVTTIGNYAFTYCDNLTSVTIGNSVTTIGTSTFNGCKSLTSAYCKATTPPSLGDTSVFDSNGSGRTIYVPTESVDAYKSATNWSEYADAIMGYDFENNIPAE